MGGKTGINHPLGKNMIGAFQQPQVVLADMAQLSTLPDRELSAGLAEVIKYALLGDLDFLLWLEENMDGLAGRDSALLAEAVYRSCAHKARIVANDEKEQGERALLNLGHTFGHAIESYLGYGVWLHGEAVATGMVMAADLSQRMGWISAEDLERTKKIIQRAHLPVKCPAIPLDEFLAYMAHDKKVLNGQLRLVLMKSLGQAVISKRIRCGIDGTSDFSESREGISHGNPPYTMATYSKLYLAGVWVGVPVCSTYFLGNYR